MAWIFPWNYVHGGTGSFGRGHADRCHDNGPRLSAGVEQSFEAAHVALLLGGWSALEDRVAGRDALRVIMPIGDNMPSLAKISGDLAVMMSVIVGPF
jgi:hypothetical protein